MAPSLCRETPCKNNNKLDLPWLIESLTILLKESLFSFSGLPNDLYVYWQQYPWIFGLGLCKIRALVSEM